MQSIRVKSGIEIEVNDAGETIVAHVEDTMFVNRFYGLLDTFDKISRDFEGESVKEMTEREQLQFVIDKNKQVMEEMDGLFGENCCRKVFGEIIPSSYLVADFFDQLIPIFEKYANERQKVISNRYNRRRKGASGSKYRTKEEILEDNMR